jgi:hypothetical protein
VAREVGRGRTTREVERGAQSRWARRNGDRRRFVVEEGVVAAEVLVR